MFHCYAPRKNTEGLTLRAGFTRPAHPSCLRRLCLLCPESGMQKIRFSLIRGFLWSITNPRQRSMGTQRHCAPFSLSIRLMASKGSTISKSSLFCTVVDGATVNGSSSRSKFFRQRAEKRRRTRVTMTFPPPIVLGTVLDGHCCTTKALACASQ